MKHTYGMQRQTTIQKGDDLPSWKSGDVRFYFMGKVKGWISKKVAMRKIQEANKAGEFQIVTGRYTNGCNFLSIHNAEEED